MSDDAKKLIEELRNEISELRALVLKYDKYAFETKEERRDRIDAIQEKYEFFDFPLPVPIADSN